MPTYNEHKQKVKENQAFLEDIRNLNPRYVCWEIIGGFYLLLHAFEKLFDISVYQNGRSNILQPYERHSTEFVNHSNFTDRRKSPHIARDKIIEKLVRLAIIPPDIKDIYDDIRLMSNIARYDPLQKFFNNYLLSQNHCPDCNSDNINIQNSVSFCLKCESCGKEFGCNFKEIDEIYKDIKKSLRILSSI